MVVDTGGVVCGGVGLVSWVRGVWWCVVVVFGVVVVVVGMVWELVEWGFLDLESLAAVFALVWLVRHQRGKSQLGNSHWSG